jgi:hypothetical protein
MNIEQIIDAVYEKFMEYSSNQPKTNDELKKHTTNALDQFRLQLEPYIYQYLLWTYGQKLNAFWETHEFPIKSKYAWVMVERRAHPNIWFLLRNIAWAAPNFSVYIFCSNMNYNFIKDVVGNKKNINIIPWFEGFVTRDEGKEQYNQTFKNPEFYKIIDAEYMITIQTDCFFRKKIPESIFVGDYYGSPWGWYLDKPGGGGITVRKISSMIKLTSTIPYSEGAEDAWIGDNIEKIGGIIPPFVFRYKIFSENFPVEDPIGVHQFWTFIQNFDVQTPELLRKHYTRYLTIDI